MHRKDFRARLRKAGKDTGNLLKQAAWQTCKLTCWIICAPCLCCALICLPRRGRRGCVISEDYRELVLPEVPAPRRRAMSLPLVEAQQDQKTLAQPQSDFLTKLPLEIRRMIYKKALGTKSVHLMTVQGKAYARQCRHTDCQCINFDIKATQSLSLNLNLLRTCRQIYSEAIEYLYTSNKFSLATDGNEAPTIYYLSYYFLPQRLCQIRDLRIHWEIDNNPYSLLDMSIDPKRAQPWTRSWVTLSRLTGLRRLHINLVLRFSDWADWYDELWKDRGEQLLQVVKMITAPNDFIIVLPSRRCSTDIYVAQSKCKFRLPEENT